MRQFSTAADPKGDKIRSLLSDQLKPSVLNVIDMSGGCGSMYRIEIVSKEFNDKSILKQHRQVNDILKDVIPTLHGLTLQTKGDAAQ
ncbi:hypothetical protein SAMD00019534_091510 [Acytostelium subglobosum LB1]|uniref:hypothetical protein n=1 Tax=Acytostelium subglobosum LB1 TaxID=1410327 RepID=UPI000644BF89|nr:hypothetical protein SAMD00019534_091510 [Acytostelium subglobosum LB1]GAM25976.1 hypothetical protein SAMD00019534_091510 [Acytostelium subglobosum LB1]|eukprot:XP_012751019.1 hypothetical protein SAMD00019534_091510 [Acytostelium subglobosum LB1]